MPRKSRFYLPNIPVHIVQRGQSRDPVFFEAQDYATYAYWVSEAAKRYNVSVHAFVLMTNHIHLLITPLDGDSVSRFMQFIGRRYVPYINHKYGRSGSIWEGRYKASLVQAEEYFLTVMRYIELNPVRAGMVASPGHYRWSSFCHNIGVRDIGFIDFHEAYEQLGRTKEARCRAYGELFSVHIDGASMRCISEAWQSGTPLGNEYFKDKIEKQLSKKVGQARRGRPMKSK
ncbi:MAG: transposase [Cellvibrionaceae bacterium]